MCLIDMKNKGLEYFENPRYDIQELIPNDSGRVLDVGCGTGLFGKILKENGAKEVVGIEINKEAAKIAKNRLDRVIIGDIEEINLPFNKEYFDYMVYADILEHLIDPWSVLKEHYKFLNKDGQIIVSIPNIRHVFIFKNLFLGDWPYTNRGILDKTHLRFFTLKTGKKLIESRNYKIRSIKKIYRLWENPKSQNKILQGINFIFSKIIPHFPLLRDFFVFQYIFIGDKNESSPDIP